MEQEELKLSVDEEKEVQKDRIQEGPLDKSKLSHGEKVNDSNKEEVRPEKPLDKKPEKYPQAKKVGVYKLPCKRNLEKNLREVVKLRGNMDQQTRGFTNEFSKQGAV